MNISYADETRIVRGETEFIVKYPHNRISAQVGDVRYDRVITVKTKEQWELLFQLSVFAGFNYLLYGVVRKYKNITL